MVNAAVLKARGSRPSIFKETEVPRGPPSCSGRRTRLCPHWFSHCAILRVTEGLGKVRVLKPPSNPDSRGLRSQGLQHTSSGSDPGRLLQTHLFPNQSVWLPTHSPKPASSSCQIPPRAFKSLFLHLQIHFLFSKVSSLGLRLGLVARKQLAIGSPSNSEDEARALRVGGGRRSSPTRHPQRGSRSPLWAQNTMGAEHLSSRPAWRGPKDIESSSPSTPMPLRLSPPFPAVTAQPRVHMCWFFLDAVRHPIPQPRGSGQRARLRKLLPVEGSGF